MRNSTKLGVFFFRLFRRNFPAPRQLLGAHRRGQRCVGVIVGSNFVLHVPMHVVVPVVEQALQIVSFLPLPRFELRPVEAFDVAKVPQIGTCLRKREKRRRRGGRQCVAKSIAFTHVESAHTGTRAPRQQGNRVTEKRIEKCLLRRLLRCLLARVQVARAIAYIPRRLIGFEQRQHVGKRAFAWLQHLPPCQRSTVLLVYHQTGAKLTGRLDVGHKRRRWRVCEAAGAANSCTPRYWNKNSRLRSSATSGDTNTTLR